MTAGAKAITYTEVLAAIKRRGLTITTSKTSQAKFIDVQCPCCSSHNPADMSLRVMSKLQRLLDAELAKPLPSSRKATELAGEIRQLEATVVKLIGMLVPDPPAEAGPPKSAQHQAAARTRWDRRSHRSA